MGGLRAPGTRFGRASLFPTLALPWGGGPTVSTGRPDLCFVLGCGKFLFPFYDALDLRLRFICLFPLAPACGLAEPQESRWRRGGDVKVPVSAIWGNSLQIGVCSGAAPCPQSIDISWEMARLSNRSLLTSKLSVHKVCSSCKCSNIDTPLGNMFDVAFAILLHKPGGPPGLGWNFPSLLRLLLLGWPALFSLLAPPSGG